MMNQYLLKMFGILASVFFLTAPVNAQPADNEEAAGALYGIPVETIDGEKTNLSEYRGKLLLIVNTASMCGYTPQYKTLEELYQKYKDKGLVVLGFPSNNFGNQEPGTNPEIKNFCQLTYNVSFPMFAKISVKGADMHPLYQYLTSQPNAGGDITWNFNKFLVSPDGTVLSRFDSKVEPMSEEIVSAVQTALPVNTGEPTEEIASAETETATPINPEGDMIVVLETNQGNIEVKLFKDTAPKTVENFVGLIQKGYYNGIIFHRVIPEFMIQGGDPTGTGRGGESLWGGKFEDEVTPSVKFDRKGLLAMANAGPHTNGSQFFITTVPTPWLNMKHTIFGEVVSGYETVEKMEQTETAAGDRPVKEQKILKAYVKN